MKFLYTFLFLLCTAFLFGQNWQWAIEFDTKKGASASSIKFTTTNQIIVSGVIGDTAHIGNITLFPPSNSNNYGFVAKLQNDGIPVWAKPIYVNKGNSAQNFIYHFHSAPTPDNNLVVSSHFAGTIVLGQDTLVEGTTGATFIAKLDSMGNYLWAKKFGAPEVPGSNAMQLSPPAVDNLGNIYQACTFSTYNDSAYFETDTLIGSNGGIYIVKFNANGEEQWVRQCGGQNGWNRTYDLKTDYFGNVYLTGAMSWLAVFGQDSFQVNNTRTASYLTKLDANGNFLWTRMQGATTKNDVSGQIGSTTYGVGIATSEFMVSLTGHFMDTVQIGGQTLSPLCGNDYCNNFFLASYDQDGNPKWVRQAPVTVSGSSGGNILADPNGNLFVGGHFFNNLSFDGHSVASIVMAQRHDRFLAKFDTSGTCQWLINFDNDDNGFVMDAACPYSNIIVGFSWKGSPGNFQAVGLSNTTQREFCIASLDAGYNCQIAISSGAEESNNESMLKVYPNPVIDFITIIPNSGTMDGIIKIYDAMGKPILITEAKDLNTVSIPVSHIAEGVYFIQCQSIKGTQSKPIAFIKKRG